MILMELVTYWLERTAYDVGLESSIDNYIAHASRFQKIEHDTLG